MAFITAKEVKSIREALKKEFPEIKFSVTKEHHTNVNVKVMESPHDFSDILDGSGDASINHYWIKEHFPKWATMFSRMIEIIKTAPALDGTGDEWFDDSDSMTDYFHTAYYMSLGIGKWDRPYKRVS